MSTSNATSDPITKLNGRKRPISNYARVAIPLPLSRSKTNGQAKPAVKNIVDGEAKEIQAQSAEATEPSKVNLTGENADRDGESNGPQAGASAPNSGIIMPKSNGEPAVSLNDTTKKPTQLRMQLPPDFIPSTGHPTPQTIGSDSSPAGSQVFSSASQIAKHGSAGIVFGSDTSNDPSPVPQSHNVFIPPRQVQYHSPHASVFVPPSHGHHPSESSQNYNNAYDYTISTPQRQAVPTQASHHYRDSRDSNFYADATSRRYAGHNHMPNGRHMNGSSDFTAPPGFQPYAYSAHNSTRAGLDNTMALAHHISSLFTSEDFSDVKLHISLSNDHSFLDIAGHKALLARSSPLFRLIVAKPEASQIDVLLPGKWHDLRAFREAMSWLYACSLSGDTLDVPISVPGDNSTAQMQYAIAYVEAGLFLSLPAVSQRGVEFASTILSWDNVHTALEYALEGGLHQSWTQEYAADNSAHTNSASSPTHDPFATQLLYSIMDFLVTSLPHDLFVDTSAPDLKELERLPALPITATGADQEQSVTHRSSRSVNDPRLSRIRFGELGGPSALARSISSVLFSLPYALLSILFRHPLLRDRVGLSSLDVVARAVVAEREVRRTNALEVFIKDVGARPDEVLYYKEAVTSNNKHPSCIQIARQHITII